jgi:hypothetical protein
VRQALADGQITQQQANNLIRRATQAGLRFPSVAEELEGALQQALNRNAPDDPAAPDEPPPPEETPAEENPAENPGQEAARGSARTYLQGLFQQFGFDSADIETLMTLVDGWIGEGLADVGTDAILMKFRGTDVYKRRFSGMQALIERGQAISEAEYIELERGYRRVLSSYGLPPEFYDNYDDYAKFIANDVSIQEVEERVFAANEMLNNADPSVLAELQDYYGVTQGGALAYLLDADKAQETIRQQVRAAQIGGSAERYGFTMDRTQSERLASSTVGLGADPFNPNTRGQLESTFANARVMADRERTLSGIDNETWSDMDTLDAAFGDGTKRLQSQRRARREAARFSGSGGAGRTALSQSRNF